MAAGLGFKTFNTGDVLSAADTNGYLMQGVLVFASAAARDSAITSPQEGQFAYLKDTNVTTYYTGSAWANLDTTGMTNPMTTTGDTIYSSSGSTPARLGIGTTGQVLTVAGGVPSWATPAAGGGGKVLQVVQGTTTTSTSTTSTTYIDTTLTATITPTLNTSKILVMTMQPFFFNRLTSGFEQGVQFKLLRDSTAIVSQTSEPFRFLAYKFSDTSVIAFEMAALQSMVYLDSPATTSATTYKTQFNSGQSGQTATCQKASNPASIILMEIGA
jgi:hypothetical protein